MNRCKECKFYRIQDAGGGYENELCVEMKGYDSILNFDIINDLVPHKCPFNGVPITKEMDEQQILDEEMQVIKSFKTYLSHFNKNERNDVVTNIICKLDKDNIIDTDYIEIY